MFPPSDLFVVWRWFYCLLCRLSRIDHDQQRVHVSEFLNFRNNFKTFRQCVTAVEAAWLAELGPMFYALKDTMSGGTERLVGVWILMSLFNCPVLGQTADNSVNGRWNEGSRTNSSWETRRKRASSSNQLNSIDKDCRTGICSLHETSFWTLSYCCCWFSSIV